MSHDDPSRPHANRPNLCESESCKGEDDRSRVLLATRRLDDGIAATSIGRRAKSRRERYARPQFRRHLNAIAHLPGSKSNHSVSQKYSMVVGGRRRPANQIAGSDTRAPAPHHGTHFQANSTKTHRLRSSAVERNQRVTPIPPTRCSKPLSAGDDLIQQVRRNLGLLDRRPRAMLSEPDRCGCSSPRRARCQSPNPGKTVGTRIRKSL